MRSPARKRRAASPMGGGDVAASAAALGLVLLATGWWAVAALAGALSGHGWHPPALAAAPAALVRLAANHADLRRAWPVAARAALPSGTGWYLAAFALLGVLLGGLALLVRRLSVSSRRLRRPTRQARESGARWAEPQDFAALRVRGPGGGRLLVGVIGRHLLATEVGQSLLVVGPTQSGKTSGLAVPAILEWDGPVVATSVKTDLLRATFPWRQSLGRVLVYDPAEVAGRPGAGWSPLPEAATWQGARKVASALCSVARTGGQGGLEDAGFWYATAEKLLAPLLLAAAVSGASMEDVVRWVDTEEVAEVLAALALVECPEAVQAAEASFSREERQRASVYTTAETVLAAFADPVVARAARSSDIDPSVLLNGGRDTCYLVAPAHEQERLQHVFTALLRSILDAAFTTSTRSGRPLDPPLLLVLDEAANVAPLAGLDALAATAASHGIQLVTLWQDLAQIEARYGSRAATVVNNHRAKLVCSGVADPSTLEQVSRLIGEEEHLADSTSIEKGGSWSRTTSPATRRLAPGDRLRRLAPGAAVLLYGHLAPVLLALRPYYAEPELARRAGLRRRRTGRRRRQSPPRRP